MLIDKDRIDDAVLALLDEGVIGGWARQEIAMTFPLNEGAPVRKTAAFRTDHGQPDAAPSFNGFLAGLQRLAAAARYKAEYFPDRALYRLPRSPLEFFVANVLSSSLLKKVFEVSRWATLIQDPSARRTKDSQPSGFGFEYCASHVRFRVFQQTARRVF